MRMPAVPCTIPILVMAGILVVAACVPRPASLASPPATAPDASTIVGASSLASDPGTTPPVVPVGPTPIASFARPTPLPAPTFLAYTVMSGDTLTSIAREFHTTPRSIAFWSRAEHPTLDPESASYQPDRLELGWVLLLIPDTVFDEDALMDPTPSPTASASAN